MATWNKTTGWVLKTFSSTWQDYFFFCWKKMKIYKYFKFWRRISCQEMTVCMMRPRPWAERRADKVKLRPSLAYRKQTSSGASYVLHAVISVSSWQPGRTEPPPRRQRWTNTVKNRKQKNCQNGHFSKQLVIFSLDSTCPPQHAIKKKKKKE